MRPTPSPRSLPSAVPTTEPDEADCGSAGAWGGVAGRGCCASGRVSESGEWSWSGNLIGGEMALDAPLTCRASV
jgi:hypothetical protein